MTAGRSPALAPGLPDDLISNDGIAYRQTIARCGHPACMTLRGNMMSKDAAARDRRETEFPGMPTGLSAGALRDIPAAPGGSPAGVFAICIIDPRTGQ